MILIIFGCFFLTLAQAKSVCYDHYGCFSNGSPYKGFLPQSPSVVKTTFYLHTDEDQESPPVITTTSSRSVLDSGFDASKNTVIIVHGWQESKSTPWVGEMANALLERDDLNVIVTDWSGGSKTLNYPQSVGNCRLVGRQISDLIKRLHGGFHLKLSSVHLIGFSLGAQIMGFAGSDLKRDSFTVARITGLDPAAPSFESNDPIARLDPTDAEFVDVIHTNAKHFGFGRIGVNEVTGHLDFYPNGGLLQPGCHNAASVFDKAFITCSHVRAPKYFIESINSLRPFTAYPCHDFDNFERGACTSCPSGGCPKMGYDAKKPADTGKKFYLLTKSESPFCVYQYKITFKTGDKANAGLYFGIVKIKIVGDETESREISLPHRLLPGGSTESFIVGVSRKIGNVENIKVLTQNNSWYLEKVILKDLTSGETSTISFNEWLKKK